MHTQRALVESLFPEGIPGLWCPLISHYLPDGSANRDRIRAHLDFIAPHVRGLLIPGSTGDGWEMSQPEVDRLLELTAEEASRRNMHLLVGVLKTTAAETIATIRETSRRLEATGAKVAGFTVCPPKGADLDQQTIRDALASVLDLGHPTALYQLPQVTQNEMSPDTVASLAGRFPNFTLFKDTSGRDRVAASGLDLGGVFLVRGAEGGYANWIKPGGGPYDGFLLSTANALGSHLAAIRSALESGNSEGASQLSSKLSSLIEEMFKLVGPLPFGNAFANANKAMDHCMAFGANASKVPGPRTHSGNVIPDEVIRRTHELLTSAGFAPQRGYLA